MKLISQFFMNAKLALRNIWRNRRRSSSSILSIAVGTAMLILFYSFINTMYIGLKDYAINHEYGHFQIALKGYFDVEENSTEHLFNIKHIELIESELARMDEVDFLNRRAHIVGLIGNMEKSAFFSGVAGDVESENLMANNLMKGNILSAKYPNGIMIGAALAKKLSLDTNEHALMFVSSESGAQEAIYANIRGIYSSVMKNMERVVAYMPIEAAWNLMLEKKIHKLQVFLRDENDLSHVVQKIEKIIQTKSLGFEIRTWDRLAVFYKQAVGLFENIALIVGLIIFVIVILNISNTLYMAIHERTREIGTLRAMGSNKSEVFSIFMIEALFMGMIGVVIGVSAVYLGIPFINSMRVMLPPFPGQDEPTMLFFTINGSIVYRIVIFSIITAVVSAVVPTIKCINQQISQQLNEY